MSQELTTAQCPCAGRTLPRSARIACIYPSSAISMTEVGAVSRALAQVLGWFAAEPGAASVVAACPPGGSVNGVDFLDVELTPAQRLAYRILANRRMAALAPHRRPTLERLRTRNAVKTLKQRNSQYDLIICATSSGPEIARECFPKARILYWIHSLPRRPEESAAWRAIECADLVVVPSTALYQALFQIYRQDQFRPPVWVLPPLVDFQPSPPSPEQRSMSRQVFGLGEDDFAIAHIGRAPMKGLQVVERALASCHAGTGRLVLLSGGGKRQQCRRISANAEVRELGRLTQERLSQLYWACDLGVVPSVWFEAFGLVTAEMMSAGLCVVASQVGGVPEIIDDEQTGLLVPLPNSVPAWVARLQRVIDDDALRMRIAADGQESISPRFGAESFFREWQRLIANLMAADGDLEAAASRGPAGNHPSPDEMCPLTRAAPEQPQRRQTAMRPLGSDTLPLLK